MQGKLRAIWMTANAVRCGLVGFAMSAGLLAALSTATHAQSSDAKGTTLTPIHAGAQNGNTSAIPFFVAEEQGFFKQAGLDVSLETMGGGGAPMAAALRAGQLDVALGGAAEHMADIARQLYRGRLVGELTDNNYLILGRKGITDVRQLKGKVFGISGYNGGDQQYAEAVLSHFGIGPNDVAWVPIGNPTSRLAALLADRIDGTESDLTSLPQSEDGLIIVSADASPVPFVSLAISATQAFITADRPALVRFLAAIGKGAQFARSHPDQGMKACQDNEATAAACTLAMMVGTTSKNPFTWSSTLRLNTKAIAAMIPVVAQIVPQAKTMKLADFADTSLVQGGP